MVLTLEKIGVLTEAQHHEVATGGQAEIDMRFAPLLQMSDNLLKYKYVIKNVAYKHNKTVTFMPKPLYNCPAADFMIKCFFDLTTLYWWQRSNYMQQRDIFTHGNGFQVIVDIGLSHAHYGYNFTWPSHSKSLYAVIIR